MRNGRHSLRPLARRFVSTRPAEEAWHQFLSEREAERIVEGFLSLNGSADLTEADLEAVAPRVQALLNWCVRTRLSQTTLDLALKGFLALDWSTDQNDVVTNVTDLGRAAGMQGIGGEVQP